MPDASKILDVWFLFTVDRFGDDAPLRRGPLRNLADVELITADYVNSYNQLRLMHRPGRIPPAEAESEHYDQWDASQPAGSQTP